MTKGYTQIYDTNYKDTFALVTKINTYIILPSLVAYSGWKLHHFDVKKTLLHINLKDKCI